MTEAASHAREAAAVAGLSSERELGTALFQRDSHGINIPRGGRTTLRYVRRIIRDFELTKHDVKQGRSGRDTQ